MTAKRIRILKFDVPSDVGALSTVLSKTARHGVNLLCFLGYERGDGTGHVYAVPQEDADLNGFTAFDAVHAITPDYCGAGADAVKPLADAGIGVRACFAVAEWQTQHVILVVDDVERALDVLHALAD